MKEYVVPKTIAERALWSRKEFIKNPKNSQLDDECLIWCFNKKDNLWYSLLGNYSGKSPEEKRIYKKEWQQSVEKGAEFMYNTVIYYSKVRKQVLERDRYTCQRCFMIGDGKFHVHHILKRLEGGSDTLDNLITVCPKCHSMVDSKEYNPDWNKIQY